MQYIRLLGLITENLYPLNNISSFLPNSPGPGNHHSVLWFYEFDNLHSTYK